MKGVKKALEDAGFVYEEENYETYTEGDVIVWAEKGGHTWRGGWSLFQIMEEGLTEIEMRQNTEEGGEEILEVVSLLEVGEI